MAYSLEADWLGRNYYAGALAQGPSGFCIHHSAGTSLDMKGAFLANGTSAHYGVKDGRAVQFVEDAHGCWHAGDSWANRNLISFECVNSGGEAEGWPVSEATVDTLVELLADKCREHGIPSLSVGSNLFGHRDFSATFCPGALYPRLGEIAGRVNALLAAPALPEALAGFSDIDPSAWYVAPLERAASEGWIGGYPGGRMAPDEAVTRGQAACIIANAARAEFERPFEDVAVESPYWYEAVAWCKAKGIAGGSGGMFRPEDACTRAEFAAMLCNWRGAGEWAEPDGLEGAPDWARAALSWAVGSGVMGNGGIRPNDPCTRAEAAAMLCNLL